MALRSILGIIALAIVIFLSIACGDKAVNSESANIDLHPLKIQISRLHSVMMAHRYDLEITTDSALDSSASLNLTIAYNFRDFKILDVLPGRRMEQAGWNFLKFTTEARSDSDINATGLLRMSVGRQIGGGNGLTEFSGSTGCLVNLVVQTGPDSGGECYFPLRFYWLDCTDNSMALGSGFSPIRGIAGTVTAPNGVVIDTTARPWQNWYGPSPDCPGPKKPHIPPMIDFVDGSIDARCHGYIDARGDINANGVKNEMADAVMFCNYFVMGLSAFGNHREFSIAASDVNTDGISLSLEDLQYLIRLVWGDAAPFLPRPPAPGNLRLQTVNEMRRLVVRYTADENVGIARLVFHLDGSIDPPGMIQNRMNLLYRTSDSTATVLIYNIGPHSIGVGSHILMVIPFHGTLTLESAEAVDYQGYMIKTTFDRSPFIEK